MTRRRFPSFVGVLAALCCAAPAAAQSDAEAALDQFLATLRAEAAGVADFELAAAAPKFIRDYPHPNLPKLDPAAAGPAALKRMSGALTGNAYGDAYVRWHLQPLVNDYLEQAFKVWLTTGEHTLAPDARQKLADFYKTIPADSDKPWREESWYEPRELEQQMVQLRTTTRVRIGVPPFERYVYEEEAVEHASPARRREIEAAAAKIKEMRSKLKLVKDAKAQQANMRQRETNKMLRDYRGQLLYALLQTGDAAALTMVGDEINKQARAKQYIAIELMKYLYRALYDGYLLLYDARALASLRSSLVATARTADAPAIYLVGEDRPDAWVQPQHYNFADLAFHLIRVLDSPAALEQFRYAATAPPPGDAPRVPGGKVGGAQLTPQRVQLAIDAAVANLYTPTNDNLFLQPHQLNRSASKLYQLMRYRGNSPEYQATVNEAGNHALITWAMLAAGESYQNPHLYRRLSFVLASDTPYVFDRSMRLQMLANLSAERWQPWFERDYQWLTRAYNADKEGALSSEYGPEGPKNDFTNAQAQYGTLALWAVERSGRPVPGKVWQVIDDYWRAEQHKPDTADRAGWSVGLIHGEHKLKETAANRFATQVQPAMVAAGAAALSLTERYLYAEKLGDAGAAAKLPHLPRAIAWLDAHFKLDGKVDGVNWYFYLWNIQRVAHANGIRTLNGVDLFRDVTADVLTRQRFDGTWEDAQFTDARDRQWSRVVSTAYALLYLSDAVNSSVGISKVKFDGNWNNRPHDLWNFVERASDEYETRTVWQVVDLKLPVEALLESPLLYLATDDAFTLPDAEVDRLRAYLNAGGTLLLNPDKASPNVTRSFDALVKKLYPDAAMIDVPADHPFYTLHTAANAGLAMKMMHNGVRPVIVQFVRDVGRDLQTRPKGDAPAFALLNNIYLYAVGMNAQQRNRLQSPLLVRNAKATTRSVAIAQLAPAPEPGALEQLRTFLANEHGVDVKGAAIAPTQLKSQRVALLSTPPGYTMSDTDAKAIRDWLATSGGTLWLDAAGGTPEAIDAMSAALVKIEPDARPAPLAFDAPILTGAGLPGGHDNTRVSYRYALLARMGASNSPRLQAVSVGGRANAIIVSAEDLGAGLAGLAHWHIYGYEPESARRLLANGVLDAMK